MPNQKKRVWRGKNSFIYIQGGREKQIILGTHPWQRKKTETSLSERERRASYLDVSSPVIQGST